MVNADHKFRMAGVDDETYVEDGMVYPFAPLNEHNRRKNRRADRHESE